LGSNEAAQAGTKYNVSVINAIVLHVGMQAIAQLQNKSSQVPPSMTHSAPMDIFQHLAVDLDTEGNSKLDSEI
jgi:CCR4-NOT transcription complex subunit 1